MDRLHGVVSALARLAAARATGANHLEKAVTEFESVAVALRLADEARTGLPGGLLSAKSEALLVALRACRGQILTAIDKEIAALQSIMDTVPAAVRPAVARPLPAPERLRPGQNPEQAVRSVCEEVLAGLSGYVGAFGFGTPGGADVDIRLCFDTLDGVSQDDITAEFRRRLPGVELDLLFMTVTEFEAGIRDLIEDGAVEDRLLDGFDPHVRQAAVGDTSMFSAYIFATMKTLHVSGSAELGDPAAEALDRLTLTRDGAVGWSHFYAGCFIHEYLAQQRGDRAPEAYLDRIAKFFSRVTLGATLAALDPAELAEMKDPLVAAIRSADGPSSTDAELNAVILTDPRTRRRLDSTSVRLLGVCSRIRDGSIVYMPPTTIARLEEMLFYNAYQQGIERRSQGHVAADPLVSYALGDLMRDVGRRVTFRAGDELTRQGVIGSEVIYLPLKTSAGQSNPSVRVRVQRSGKKATTSYPRRPGRIIGESAIFGLERSATVTADGDVEAVVVDAGVIRDMLSDSDLREELQRPVLRSRDARRLDVLLRHFAVRSAMLVRQTAPDMPYADGDVVPGHNPFAAFHLGPAFHDVLRARAHERVEGRAGKPLHRSAHPVVRLSAEPTRALSLMTPSRGADRLYVVSEGTATIELRGRGGVVSRGRGEYFGESSLLGLRPSGAVHLSPGGEVLSIHPDWFMRFTQSRQPIAGVESPLEGILPVHLLYHLAAENHDRLRRQLAMQHNP